MTILDIITDLFFHSIIIIAVYERLKNLFRAISAYRKTAHYKDILAELVILMIVLGISVLIYSYMIYKPC